MSKLVFNRLWLYLFILVIILLIYLFIHPKSSEKIHEDLTVESSPLIDVYLEEANTRISKKNYSLNNLLFSYRYDKNISNASSLEVQRELLEALIKEADFLLISDIENYKQGNSSEKLFILEESFPYIEVLTEFYQISNEQRYRDLAEGVLNNVLFLAKEMNSALPTDIRAGLISICSKVSMAYSDTKFLSFAEAEALKISQELYSISQEGQPVLKSFDHNGQEIAASLKDFVLLTKGILDLYEASQDLNWFNFSKVLQDYQNDNFFYKDYYTLNSLDFSSLILENSIALMNLTRMYYFTFESALKSRIDILNKRISKDVSRNNIEIYYEYVKFLLYIAYSPKEYALIEGKDSIDFDLMKKIIARKFIPNKVIATCALGLDCKNLGIKLLANKLPIQSRTTLYVCEDNQCQFPIQDIEGVRGLRY